MLIEAVKGESLMNSRAEFLTPRSQSILRSVACVLLMIALCALVILTTTSASRPAIAIPAASAPFVVTNTNDSGGNSLRQAITAANASPGLDKIVFDIPGAGVQTIHLASRLPDITSPVIIDGYSQTGASPNTRADGDDATRLIEINGAGAGDNTNGLTIEAGGRRSRIRGLIISGFRFSGIVVMSNDNHIEGNFITGNLTRGVTIEEGASDNIIGGPTPDARNLINDNGQQGVRILPGSRGNLLQGNFIGVDRTGDAAAGNFNEGVVIAGSANLVGGDTPGARNVISASRHAAGVVIASATATDNQVRGNYIGTNANGTAALGNREEGVLIDEGATHNTIGGPSLADRNIISGNRQNGVVFGFISAANDNRVLNNFIGTAVDGVSPLGNGEAGVSIGPGSSNNAVGDQDGHGNLIAFNVDAGVRVFAAINNPILSNSIFANGSLGIDLGGDGVTPNDAGDADGGPNNMQNYPQPLTVTNIFGSRLIAGTLDSAPNTTYTVQFFANDFCDDSGSGEGRRFIATRAVTTDAAGSANFSLTVAGGFAAVTATATDPAGNTSEFSPCAINPAVADLALTLTASADTVRPGDELTYTITVTNNGASPATGITVFDALPASVTFISCATSPGGVCLGHGNRRRISFTTLPSGASVTITLTVRVGDGFEDGTAITNMATVTSPFADEILSNNTATVAFRVNRNAPSLSCPANLTLSAAVGQCGATAEYALPSTQGLVNAVVSCSPPSGATFPVGSTTVICTASDAGGGRATCGFTVSVATPLLVKVSLEGDGAALEFGPVAPVRKARQVTPSGCACSRTFSIENTGCAALTLDLAAITRTGSDVDSGKITDPDDSRFFAVRIIEANGTERAASCADGPAGCINIDPGQKMSFRVVFRPLIPAAFAGKTTRLAASDVLAARINSTLTFKRPDGATVTVALVARVATEIRLLDPEQPRRPARIVFARLDDQFTVTYAIFDSDLDPTRARYEFFDGQGRAVGEAIEVEFAEVIKQAGVVNGQSFIVTQRFSGARANPSVTGVRVTVFDSQSSDSAKGSLK
jgi:uncharacterized repeat protein (TIGR01451 family)